MSALFSQARGEHKRTKQVVLLLVAAVGFMSAIWSNRASLLNGAAEAWVVSDPLMKADAVAILGGGLETRPFTAAEYYRTGLVRKVLIADVRASPSEKIGVQPRHADLNRDVLMKLGVPPEGIETFGTAVSNTYEEALALRSWVNLNHAAVVIVPTEMFSSRRVRWMLGRALQGTGARAVVRAVEPLEYTSADWWMREQGVIAFQNEVLKYFYYRLKYRGIQREA